MIARSRSVSALTSNISPRRLNPEAVPYLHRNYVGSPVDIRCSEAKQPKAGADEAILAAVVINHAITVITAVVFDCQALIPIKQVWTA